MAATATEKQKPPLWEGVANPETGKEEDPAKRALGMAILARKWSKNVDIILELLKSYNCKLSRFIFSWSFRSP